MTLVLPSHHCGPESGIASQDLVSERLIKIIARILGISANTIHLFDSFIELGGNIESAEELRAACLSEGIDVKCDDILSCPMLAELQTRMKPFPPISSRNRGTFIDQASLLVHHESHDRVDTVSSDWSTSADGGHCPAAKVDISDVDKLLNSLQTVSDVFFMTPEAGCFQRQPVALVEVKATSRLESMDAKRTGSAAVPDGFDTDAKEHEIRLLRLAAKAMDIGSWQSLVWIPITRVSDADSLGPDVVRLQGLVHDMDNFTYEWIMTLQGVSSTCHEQPSHDLKHDETEGFTSADGSLPVHGQVQEQDVEGSHYIALSYMQRLYLVAMTREKGISPFDDPSSQYSQHILLEVHGTHDSSVIQAAATAVVFKHDMLRARFEFVDGKFVQYFAPQIPDSFRFTRHIEIEEKDLRMLVDGSFAALDPVNGPVFTIDCVQLGERQMIHMAAHQLVIDSVSWSFILLDLDRFLCDGCLPSANSSPQIHWPSRFRHDSDWMSAAPIALPEISPADLGYWGLNAASNTHMYISKSSFRLDVDILSTLESLSAEVLRADMTDVIMASLLLSFRQVFPRQQLPTLWRQESKRGIVRKTGMPNDVVGCFAQPYPIAVSMESTTNLIHAIKLVKDSDRAIRGGSIADLASGTSLYDAHIPPLPMELLFSVTDTVKQLQESSRFLKPWATSGQKADASLVFRAGSSARRLALFEVHVSNDVSGAQVDFSHNDMSRYQGSIDKWKLLFERHILDAIVALRCHQPELTLSDVPLLRSSYKALAGLSLAQPPHWEIPDVLNIETIFPITRNQQDILMSQAQHPDAFHVFCVYELSKTSILPVDIQCFCEVWEAIVARTSALRSTFIQDISENGLYDQLISKKVSASILLINSPDPHKDVFNLPVLHAASPRTLHRLTLSYNSDRILLRLDASQAICDLTSLRCLMVRLIRGYCGSSPPDDIRLYYSYLSRKFTTPPARSLNDWRLNISKCRPCLFPHLTFPTITKQQIRWLSFNVTRQELHAFCEKHSARMSTIFQLAWALVLRAFAGGDHATFGYQFSDRDKTAGLRDISGSFDRLLPCRIEVFPHRRLSECLQELGRHNSLMEQHTNVTMADIERILALKNRDLFNTCISFQDSDSSGCQQHNSVVPDISTTTITAGANADCDLSLTAMFIDDRVRTNLCSTLVSPDQARTIMFSFESALRGILSHSGGRVIDIDLSTGHGCAHLPVSGPKIETTARLSACLHDVILQHVKLRPRATAICTSDREITYEQLCRLVRRLGDHLISLGVGVGMVIPAVLEKNCYAPIVLLAVMQAGASFVLLDGGDVSKIKSTVRYLQPQVIVTNSFAHRHLSKMIANLVIVNDGLFQALLPRQSIISSLASSESVACIFVAPRRTRHDAFRCAFFTHASLVSAFTKQGPVVKMNSASRVLNFSALSVDIALVEILGTMVHGGCVCIPSATTRESDITSIMTRMNITWSYMTDVLARQVRPALIPTLDTLCFRTRKLHFDTCAPLIKSCSVFVAYGAPDICPLGISFTRITKDEDLRMLAPPIAGKFWIRDFANVEKFVPEGAVGELVIDSPLTPYRLMLRKPLADNTITEYLRKHNKPRYLKTGYRVRYSYNNGIDFISSIRDDLLLNGVVIDTATVEHQLRHCLNEKFDVIVDVITSKDSVNAVAAFFQFGPTMFFQEEDLRSLNMQAKEETYIVKQTFLASVMTPNPGEPRIHKHDIPTIFVPLKQFPLTTSLKVSRHKLREMAAKLSYTDLIKIPIEPGYSRNQSYTLNYKPLPLTGPEESMRVIWAYILGVSPYDIVGSHTFSSLGGNRALAARLIITCRRLGVHISTVRLLQDATLAEIVTSMSG